MTKEQHALMVRTLRDLFGECSTEVDVDALSIRVDVKRSSVLVCSTGIEVESVSGPMMVAGFSIGLVNDEGEYQEAEETTNFWQMVSVVAELVSEQEISHAQWGLEAARVQEEQQYE